MRSGDTRERILDAAERVINRIGFGMVTFDAIATEAQVSKGGVIHYFKTKNQCLTAVLDRVYERILNDTIAIHDTLPPSPGRMLKAYIISWVKWQEPPRTIQIKGLLDNDVLREHLIDRRIEHYEFVLDEDIPTDVVWKVLLICAGLWTTPLLARASQQELSAFFEMMKNEMLHIIDQAAEKSLAEKAKQP